MLRIRKKVEAKTRNRTSRRLDRPIVASTDPVSGITLLVVVPMCTCGMPSVSRATARLPVVDTSLQFRNVRKLWICNPCVVSSAVYLAIVVRQRAEHLRRSSCSAAGSIYTTSADQMRYILGRPWVEIGVIMAGVRLKVRSKMPAAHLENSTCHCRHIQNESL